MVFESDVALTIIAVLGRAISAHGLQRRYRQRRAGDVEPAINAVIQPSVVDSSIYVDYDDGGTVGGFGPLTDLTNTSATGIYSVASSAQVNHAPYGVAGMSTCCSKGEADDASNYTTLVSDDAIFSTALAIQVGGALPAGTAPPTLNTAVSSPNSGNGGTGWGIDFALPSGYLGLDTTTDSANTAAMTGFLAALKYMHPTWNWFDIKAALRQTAQQCQGYSTGGWSNGYSYMGFGYGCIDWGSANSVSGTSAIYLQPPGLAMTTTLYGNENTGAEASFTLYPFMTSRRAGEVIYAFSQQPIFPSPSSTNEYTYAQISSLLDSYGGSLIYISGGASGVETPQPYTASNTETVNFVAFTVDNTSNLAAANFSRAEQAFSVLSANLNPPTPPVNPAIFYASHPAAYVSIFRALKLL